MADKNSDEPTLALEDNELSLSEDEPTMQIEEEAAEAGATENLSLSDAEVGTDENEEDGYSQVYSAPVVQEEAPSSANWAFNAMLVVSFFAYSGALALLLYRLSQYSAKGALPW